MVPGCSARWFALSVVFVLSVAAVALAVNPIPTITGPVQPQAVVPGSGAFTLTVYGANFVQGATVNWNRQPRTTTFISARKLQAQILASDVASPTAGHITVTNPPPGGGVSSSSYGLVEVHTPTKTIVAKKPHTYFTGGGAAFADLADFNNDGILDFASNAGRTVIEVLRGSEKGTFGHGSIATHYYYGDGPAAIASGDFNNDGNEDLVFGANPHAPPYQLGVSLGKGDGKFGNATHFGQLTTYASGLTAGDFNRDGNLDVVSVTACCLLSVFLGNGDGSFQLQVDYTQFLGTPYEVHNADLNGDGILDLVVVTGYVYVQLGRGDGTFQKPKRVAATLTGCGFGPALFVTDFNGDGEPDLAYCEQDVSSNLGKIWVALGKGDGTFKKPVSIVVHAYGGVFSFAAGDFNSDGQTDLVANYFTSSKFDHTETDLFLGNGDGTFQKKRIITLPGEPYYNAESGIAPADFNSDGLLDFVSLAPGEADVFVQK